MYQYMKKNGSKIISIVSVFLMGAFQSAMAALPTATNITTGTGVTNTTSPIAFVKSLLTSGVGVAAVAVGALTVLGVSWASYTAFVDSRQKGEWKNFGVTASVGVVLIVGVILLALLANQYAA